MAPSQKITDWEIDPVHSTFEFAVRHMRVSTVKGAFSGVSGEIHFDPDDVASSSIQAEIDMSTVDSHNEGRDETLRGERFFEVEKYPTASFVSKQVRPNADGSFQVIGDLTMHGETNEVAFHTVFEGLQMTPADIYRGAFTARATIQRTDFGFSESTPLPGGGFSLSNDVELAMFTSVKPKEE
ncbi:YceI family protein [soil metagenome]